MIDPMRGTKALVLGAMALCVVGSVYGAKADDKNSSGLRVAVVDPQRLINEDAAYNAKVDDINRQQREVAAELQTVSQNYLLPEAEQKELTTLALKPATTMSDADKARKKALLDKSKAAFDDFETLSRKQAGQLTPAEDTRVHDFIKMREDATTRAQSRQQNATEDLQKQAGENMKTTLKSVHDALAKVAHDKGYSLVLSNELAWYADADLTDDTLKVLNRK